MEAVWIITNLVYGTGKEIEPIFEEQYGIIPTITNMLNTKDRALIEQCLWFLGNAIADNMQIRDLILA